MKFIFQIIKNQLNVAKKLSGVFRWVFIKHVLFTLATPTFGALFVTPFVQNIRRILGRLKNVHDISELKIAIVAHAYHPELIPEILACRRVLPRDVPLYLTVSEERIGDVNQTIEGEANITVFPVENRGRDIAPFLHVLQTGELDAFDAVLKLHTKRSVHLMHGNIRRKLLFLTLCGERFSVLRALTAFRNESTGMVGWGLSFRCELPYVMENKSSMCEITREMGAGDSFKLGFFEGSMFWFRPSAFEPIRGLNLSVDDFEPEEGQLDGALGHALERCFTISTWHKGMEVRDMRGRLLVGCDVPGGCA